jgi:hypothetical protein
MFRFKFLHRRRHGRDAKDASMISPNSRSQEQESVEERAEPALECNLVEGCPAPLPGLPERPASAQISLSTPASK